HLICYTTPTSQIYTLSLHDALPISVDHEGRAGLAANQIGVSLRAFSWNIEDDIGYVLNPRLVEVSEDEYQDGDEGCLSVPGLWRSEEHTSELQSRENLVCRLLLEKK